MKEKDLHALERKLINADHVNKLDEKVLIMEQKEIITFGKQDGPLVPLKGQKPGSVTSKATTLISKMTIEAVSEVEIAKEQKEEE